MTTTSTNFSVDNNNNNNNLLISQLDLPSGQADSVLQALDPKAHVYAYWKNETRPDGRLFTQARTTSKVKSIVKHSNGSALIKQGNTKILAAITTQIGQPSPDNPECGDVIVNVTNEGHTDTLQSWLQRMLDDILPTKLNLLTGKACIRLIISVMVLQDDGNIMDVALLACMAAWNDTTLPSIDDLQEVDGKLWLRSNTNKDSKINESKVTTTVTTTATSNTSSSSSKQKEDSQKNNNHTNNEYRISLSMGIIRSIGSTERSDDDDDDENRTTQFIVDPTLIEEQQLEGCLTMVVNIPSKTIQAEYSGFIGLSSKDIALATKMAYGRAEEIMELLL